ncbi:MAG: metal-dependent hydrolase [Thermoplasmata archaeon]|nr:metal-dependent hydrolase [Thermoplasmata archaeon]
MATGMAIGAVISRLADSSWPELVCIGAVAGLLPDSDVFLMPLSRNAHRSVWTHSLSGSALLSLAWLLILVVALRGAYLPFSDSSAATTSVAVVFIASFAHAGEDALTFQGCRLLHPITGRRFSGPFRYNDIMANAIISLVSLGVMLACLGAFA